MPPAHPALRKYRLDYPPGTTSFRFRQSLMRSLVSPGFRGWLSESSERRTHRRAGGSPKTGPKIGHWIEPDRGFEKAQQVAGAKNRKRRKSIDTRFPNAIGLWPIERTRRIGVAGEQDRRRREGRAFGHSSFGVLKLSERTRR